MEIEVYAEVVKIQSDPSRLFDLEDSIRKGINSLAEMGRALQEIRDSKLFVGEYKSFKDYLAKKWGLSEVRGWHLINHAQVIDLFIQEGLKTLPTNENQTRPLYELNPQEQVAIWRSVLEETPNPTGSAVKKKICKAKEAVPSIKISVQIRGAGLDQAWVTENPTIEELNDIFMGVCNEYRLIRGVDLD